MMGLNKKDILGAVDIKIEKVEVPEWGGVVYVKGLTGAERDAFEGSIVQINGSRQKINLTNIRAKLAIYSICDENGVRLFQDEDINLVAGKSAQALQRIFDVAQRLSGLTSDDMDSLLKN